MERKNSLFRQIHLDFHTSELIENIAGEFDPEEFAQTLERARVNSINLFARCHHGMLYYDSKKFPERVHPHLKKRDFLTQQVEACHRHNIHVNLYTTVRWDLYSVREHPEWVVIDENGRLSDHEGKKFFEAGFYINLCVNTAYRDFLKEHLQEVLQTIPVDGVWFDASFVVECCCKNCLRAMKAAGLDPTKAADRQEHSKRVYHDFVNDMSSLVRQYNPKFSIFYNKGHVGMVDKSVLSGYTYAAFESLPGGPWGYLDFPISVRYVRTLDIDCVGMTGRFHTSWGDFHSFRNKAALEFECFNMLALGAKCNIGDQLEPSGKLSEPMYRLIGSVYSEVEKKEPWCLDAKPVTEIGVFTPEEFYGADTGKLPVASEGICRMLQEGGYQFDFIDSQANFDRYQVLILPDVIPVSPSFAAKLEKYLDQGGAVVASFESGLDSEKRQFMLKSMGARYIGEASYNPDFIIPKGEIGKGLPETEHVMYLRGTRVEPVDGGQVLMETAIPVFNRSYEHFSSHLHAPSSGKIGYPAVIRSGNCIYFSHPIFTQYHQNAPLWCKKIFINALRILLPKCLLRHDGPSTMLTTINEQAGQKRWVVHLLHYIPERRSATMDIIEDVIPLYNIKLQVRAGKKITSVECVPQGLELSFNEQDASVEFLVPEIRGHQMVALNFTD
jgi:hypothetical protein